MGSSLEAGIFCKVVITQAWKDRKASLSLSRFQGPSKCYLSLCLKHLCSSEVLPSSGQRKGKLPPPPPSSSPSHWKQCRLDSWCAWSGGSGIPPVPFQNLQRTPPHLLVCLTPLRGHRNQGTWTNKSAGKHGGTGRSCSEPDLSFQAPKASHASVPFSPPRFRSITQPSSSTSMTGGQSIMGGTLQQGCWCSSLPYMCVMRWVAQCEG